LRSYSQGRTKTYLIEQIFRYIEGPIY
jgi:hypothetical protein